MTCYLTLLSIRFDLRVINTSDQALEHIIKTSMDLLLARAEGILDDYAKDVGEELFTKMYCDRIKNP